MNKTILIILIGMMILPMVFAADYLPHKQRTDFELLVASNNATSCNWTYIQYPDNTKTMAGITMTRSGTNYYVTVLSTNFSQLGSTCMGITCMDANSDYETGTVCREVTPDGFVGTLGFYILILLLSGGIMVLGFWKEDAPIVILGSFGLYFIGLYILFFGIVGLKDVTYTCIGLYILFFGIVGLKDVTYTWALGIIVLMLAAYISIRSAYELITG